MLKFEAGLSNVAIVLNQTILLKRHTSATDVLTIFVIKYAVGIQFLFIIIELHVIYLVPYFLSQKVEHQVDSLPSFGTSIEMVAVVYFCEFF